MPQHFIYIRYVFKRLILLINIRRTRTNRSKRIKKLEDELGFSNNPKYTGFGITAAEASEALTTAFQGDFNSVSYPSSLDIVQSNCLHEHKRIIDISNQDTWIQTVTICARCHKTLKIE